MLPRHGDETKLFSRSEASRQKQKQNQNRQQLHRVKLRDHHRMQQVGVGSADDSENVSPSTSHSTPAIAYAAIAACRNSSSSSGSNSSMNDGVKYAASSGINDEKDSLANSESENESENDIDGEKFEPDSSLASNSELSKSQQRKVGASVTIVGSHNRRAGANEQANDGQQHRARLKRRQQRREREKEKESCQRAQTIELGNKRRPIIPSPLIHEQNHEQQQLLANYKLGNTLSKSNADYLTTSNENYIAAAGLPTFKAPSRSHSELTRNSYIYDSPFSLFKSSTSSLSGKKEALEETTTRYSPQHTKTIASKRRRTGKNFLIRSLSTSSIFAYYATKYAKEKFHLALRTFKTWYHEQLTYHHLSKRMEFNKYQFDRWYKSKGQPLSLKALDHYDQVVIWIAGKFRYLYSSILSWSH